MKKSTFLKIVQDKMPDDIIIEDTTSFEFTEDECVGILSWIEFFNCHYSIYNKHTKTKIQRPSVSKRLLLDFGLYNIPCDLENNKGKYIVYLAEYRNITSKLKIEDLARFKVK